jgi:hypothetical protein
VYLQHRWWRTTQFGYPCFEMMWIWIKMAPLGFERFIS